MIDNKHTTEKDFWSDAVCVRCARRRARVLVPAPNGSHDAVCLECSPHGVRCECCGISSEDMRQIRGAGLDYGAAGVLQGGPESVCCETIIEGRKVTQ